MALPITISNKGLAVTISENGFGVPVVIVSGELPTAQAPTLEGGALTKDGADLVVTAPVVTAGSPTPSVNFTLTRDATDVRGEVVNGRIVNAAPGTYVATWTASNGIGSPATATDTEVVSATAPGQFGPNDWEFETGSGPSELRLNIVKLPATGGSPITALEYNIDGGEFVALSGLNVGARVLTMPQGGTAYSGTVRAVNAVGAGTASAAKVATSNVVPALTATPPALAAGQQASITFNTAPDSVTISQGGATLTATRVGTTNEWQFTPATTQPVSISATKAGYTAFSAVIENVQPAPPEIAVTSDNTAELRNVTSTTAPFDLTINAPARYAGTRQVNPADGISGPIRHVAPVISGNAVVGETLTLDPGFWLTLAGDMDLSWTWPDGSTGLTYTVRAADRGTGVTIQGEAEDANGTRPMQANSIAIPAPPATLNPGATPIGAFDGGTGASATTHTETINIGPADPAKVVYIFLARPNNTTINGVVKLVANGTDYVGSVVDAQADATSALGLDLLRFPCPVGGEVTLSVIRQVTTQRPRGFVYATKDLVDVASDKVAWTMTADTPISEPIGATNPGDTIIRAVLSPQYDATGLFGSPNILTEVYDQPFGPTGPQLWIGHGIDTAGNANRSLTLTPKQTGRWIHIAHKLRNA